MLITNAVLGAVTTCDPIVRFAVFVYEGQVRKAFQKVITLLLFNVQPWNNTFKRCMVLDVQQQTNLFKMGFDLFPCSECARY